MDARSIDFNDLVAVMVSVAVKLYGLASESTTNALAERHINAPAAIFHSLLLRMTQASVRPSATQARASEAAPSIRCVRRLRRAPW